MINVRPNQLKKCIVLDGTEFRHTVKSIIETEVCVEYALDGIYIYPTNENETEITDEYLYQKLAEHFGVKEITSIHTDDKDDVCVWIAYN